MLNLSPLDGTLRALAEPTRRAIVERLSGGPASVSDLARTMVWLRDHSAATPTTAARGVLAVNPGIGWPAGTWKYAGFKGGSEPGVVNLTFLLQRTDGVWFVLAATWNNPARAVDEAAFAALVNRAGVLLARGN